jgi:hypothetical protein
VITLFVSIIRFLMSSLYFFKLEVISGIPYARVLIEPSSIIAAMVSRMEMNFSFSS